MEQRQIFLRDILAVVFKRKGLIVTFAVAVFAVVAVGNYMWPPVYESTAKIRIMRRTDIEEANPTVLRTPGLSYRTMQMTQEDVRSEIELIYSNDVLEKVAKDLGLDKNPPEASGPLHLVLRGAKAVVNNFLYALALKTRPEPLEAAVELLRESIEVTPVKDTHVLEISAQLGKPEAAQEVLQKLLEVYLNAHVAAFRPPATAAFFAKQIEEVSQKLAEAQEKLTTFRNENKVLSVEEEEKLLLEEYRKAKESLVRLEETESLTQDVAAETPGDQFVEILSRDTGNTVVTELQLRLLELLLERDRMAQSLGPKHPEVAAVNQSIANARDQLRSAIQTSLAVTEKQIASIEARIEDINKLKAELEALERDVRIQSNAQEYYALKVEEARVSDAMSQEEISNVKVISSPDLRRDPVKPRKLLNLALAVVGGVIGGVALAFFLDYLDHGLKTPEDVEHYLGLRPLASFFRSRGDQIDPKEAERLASLVDSTAHKPLHLTQVNSAAPGEGSQRVARALAEAFANDPSAKTLLVDLVTPGAGPGFTDVVMDGTDPGAAISAAGKLYTLNRGSRPECPSYVWASENMRRAIERLRREYSRIVVHTPPVLQSHDAINLAQMSDGVLLVIRADSTRREVVQRAADMLARAGGTTLGAVLMDRTQAIPNAVYRRI